MDINEEPGAQSDAPPTWEQLRAEGGLLIDDAIQKLGIYIGAEGALVLMHADISDQAPAHLVIDPSFAPTLSAALTKFAPEAERVGKEFWERVESEYAEAQAKHAIDCIRRHGSISKAGV
jgi:hypothetical protein